MSIDVICAVILLACSLILISHCKYEEGLIGRLALLLLAITEVVVIAEAWHDAEYVLAPTTILRHVAVTLFLTRHTYRFLAYYYCGRYKWAEKMAGHK